MIVRTVFALAFVAASAHAQSFGAPPTDISDKLDKLARAYPDFVASHDAQWLYMKDGRKFAST